MRIIGLLGGSFNPIHIGHIRLAMEIVEALKPSRLDLIPCAQAPHKNAQGFLPFELRCQLAECALDEVYEAVKEDFDGTESKAMDESVRKIQVNRIEGERQGPSYTWDTLVEYRQKEADARLFFVLGGEDFGKLSSWYRGKEIPYMTDIVVVPRDNASHSDFIQTIEYHWPEAKEINAFTWTLPNGHKFIYQPLPRLDISSSLLRKKWLSHCDITFLVPKNVEQILEAQRSNIQNIWCQ